MLEIGSFQSAPSQPFSRRAFVKAGATLPFLAGLPNAVQASNGKAKSTILIWLWGGPSHIDLWDPKPDAPSEVKSPFANISTAIPGVHFTEIIPGLAKRLDKFSIVRSTKFSGSHDMLPLTGFRQSGPAQEPTYGAIYSKAIKREGVPSFISVAPLTTLSHGFRCDRAPGFGAGKLGPANDPFFVRCAADGKMEIPSLQLIPGLSPERLADRTLLMKQLDDMACAFENNSTLAQDQKNLEAYRMLTSPEARRAFDLSLEPEKVRGAYGRTTFGQSMLLARRLAEVGVPFIQVNWSLGVDGLEEGPLMGWDTHRNGFGQLMTYHAPVFDRAFSALLDDLYDRDMIGSTLVTAFGEMGRTPKINRTGGRDHWATCTSLWAGGGIEGGKVIGSTDKIGGEPENDPATPLMVGTTIAECMGLGIQERAELNVLDGGTTIPNLLS